LAGGAKIISVAMCSFNGEQYVEAQLESIAAQTRAPDELVICDDCSTDGTVGAIRRFAAAAKFPVRLDVNSKNIGSTKNFAKAIEMCRGDLIALCDQDDVWLAQKLELIEAEFDAREVGLVFSDAQLIDAEENRTDQRLWQQIGLDRAERARLVAGNGLYDLLRGATVTGATMAFRAKYRKLIVPIPENLPVIHDAWIALIVSCVAGIRAVEQPLVLYRQHFQQQVGAQARTSAAGGFKAITTGHATEAALRQNPYQTTLALARAASARLADAGPEFGEGKARAKLESVIRHLEARASLPRSFLQRLRPVAEELLTLRYFRFSNGLTSAAKDLLVVRSNRSAA